MKVLLEAKSHGTIDKTTRKTEQCRMWISAEIKRRILKPAGEPWAKDGQILAQLLPNQVAGVEWLSAP